MAPNTAHSTDALAARLDAVERAVATDDRDSLSTDSTVSERDGRRTADAGEPRDREADDGRDAELEALRERVATLEAELDAVRGLLDGVRAVDDSVERRADAALAKAERLESSMAADSDLVVERVRVDELDDDPSAGGNDAPPAEAKRAPEGEKTETDEETSLAARLREAF